MRQRRRIDIVHLKALAKGLVNELRILRRHFLGTTRGARFLFFGLRLHLVNRELQPGLARHADLNTQLIEDMILLALD